MPLEIIASSPRRLVASLSIIALSAPVLVACGGGDETSSSTTPLTSAPQAVRFNGEIVGNADDVHFSDVQDNTLKQALNLAGWNYCKFGAFFPLSGLQYADSCGTNANLLDVYGPAPVGFATASPAPRCLQLPRGSFTVSLTPVAGAGSADRRAHKLSCFQFVVTVSAPVPLNVNLPAGVVGVAEVAYSKLIESLLNAVPGLVDAAKSIQNAAVSVFDTEKGEGARSNYQVNGYAKTYALSYYKDVAGQLQGKVDFKALVSETQRYVTQDGRAQVGARSDWGRGALEVLESHLKRAIP